MTQTLSKNVIADFSTQLAVKMAVGATTGTLASATDSDGVALPTGTYFLTLDKNNSKKEYIKCTLTGTALTSIQSISRQGALTSGCVREHRVGANVIISDFASLSKMNDVLTGVTSFDSATPLGYDGEASITTDNQFATKKYVNDEDNAIDTVIATLDAQNVKITGNQTVAGVKTFSSSPIVPTPTTDYQVATKKYADDLSFAGVNNASDIAKGIVQEATQSEVNTGTATGSTGARLYVNPSFLPSSTLLASDGSDGDVTISSGTTTLTRDMYYNNLTVNGTGTLVTAGYRVFVKGTTTADTSGGGGGIQHKGGNGGNGGNASGGTGGTAGSAGTIANGVLLGQARNGKAGGAGANSANANGSNGTAGDSSTFNLNANAGSAGGKGGNSATAGGGTAGSAGANTSAIEMKPRDVISAVAPFVFTSATAIQRANVTAGSGSGGGGGSWASTGGGGGGGSGATGGYVFLATRILSITGIGAINANGGNGGNGGAGVSPLSGGGGGGGGGNGGVAVVAYFTKTGTGTITATAGTGGTGGASGGGGGGEQDGSNGGNGTDGLVIEITR